MTDPTATHLLEWICNGLKGLRIRFTLEIESDADLGPFPGTILRGAVAAHLRKLVCVTRMNRCDNCALQDQCAYHRLFESKGDNVSLHNGGYRDAPKPIVLHYPEKAISQLRKRDHFQLDFILLGMSHLYVNHLIYAMQRLETQGIGFGHKDGSGKFALRKVVAMRKRKENTLYTSEARQIQPAPPPDFITELADQCSVPTVPKAFIRFMTPMRLRKAKRWLNDKDLQFDHIIESLLRRQDVLNTYYGEHRSFDKTALIKEACKVRIAGRRLNWRAQNRYSYRQKQTMPMDGLLGEIELEGDVAPFWPLLQAGTMLHIGKGATMGLGQYDLAS